MKEEHIVPLSTQVLALLAELKQLSGDNPRLFPDDHDPNKVMSENTVNNARAAYIHTSEHLDERRLMVQWWADFLEANEGTIISPYDFARKEMNS